MIKRRLDYTEMKEQIMQAGGLFYQYRPCRRDTTTIYDIENIRQGVVYAQTPLNMNDPFDSMIGYSVEKIYEECIVLVIETLEIQDNNMRVFLMQLLKYKLLGKFADFIDMLNKIREYLLARQKLMHKEHTQMLSFIRENKKMLYDKCPKDIKKGLSKEVFYVLLLIVSKMNKTSITEDNLASMYKLDEYIDELNEKIKQIFDVEYMPRLIKFLSKMTVSCFSASGWDNQLMWSHYANSYAGICVEYDFNQIKGNEGLVYPVEYTEDRPTISLAELGIDKLIRSSPKERKEFEPNMEVLASYLLAKTPVGVMKKSGE